MPAKVTVRWVENGDLRTGGLADLDAARAGGAVWIEVEQPDDETMRDLGETFGIHPLSVEDFLHFPQRPKMDVYDSSAFMVWVFPRLIEGDGIEYPELDVFIGPGVLVTSHRDPIPVLDEVADCAHDSMSRGTEWTLHSILDRAVDEIFPAVDYISDQLDTIEDQLLENASRDQLHRLYSMKRLLVALHKVVGPERDIVRGMARQSELISQEAYMYFQDIGDHLARVADSVDTYREVASGAMDIYLSSVNNRMNQIMKQLTVVATIFMPLTLISGIYGMNVTVGMWPPISASWSFAGVIASMAIIAVGMLWFFKRREWW